MKLDLRYSLLLAAWGQVGGLIGGFVNVSALSLLSARNYFDSPIRAIVFTTMCGLIGGVSVFSAALSVSIAGRLLLAIPLALAIDLALCFALKVALSPAGESSPVGKLFTAVSMVFAFCVVALGRRTLKPPHIEVDGPRPRRILTIALFRGLITAIAILIVLLMAHARLPLLSIVTVDRGAIVLYVVLGFFLSGVVAIGERVKPIQRRQANASRLPD